MAYNFASDPMHKIYFRYAYREAVKSRHPEAQCASVLVNHSKGMVSCCNNDEIFPGVYEHAEKRTLYKAINAGFHPSGLTLYTTFGCFPDCAKSIVQLNLRRVIVHKQSYDQTPDSWKSLAEVGEKILVAFGVQYLMWHGSVFDERDTISVRVNQGVTIKP